jgi:hypothetical protein
MRFARLHLRIDDLIIAAAGTALGLWYVLGAGGFFPLDDSWIHQTYARNLGLNGEWAFLSGVPSAASTSPLYTVLLAIGYRLGIAPIAWTHALGITALVAAALIAAGMARQILPRVTYLPLATGLALAAAWHLIWAAASGMETMIFALLTLAVIAYVWRERAGRSQRTTHVLMRGAVFGLLAGLTTLARPEGVLLIGLCGAAVLAARPGMRWRDVILWGGAGGIIFLVVLAPYLIFNLQVTGGPLPTTSAAKQAFARPLFELNYLWRVWQMAVPLLAGGQALLLPGIIAYGFWVVFGRQGRSAAILTLPLAWGVGLILLYGAWLPLPFQHGRYVIPALPALITVGVIGTALLLTWARRNLLMRAATRALALATVLLFGVFVIGPGRAAHQLDVDIIQQEMVAAAGYIAENVPIDDLLVIHDIGAVGYFAPRPMLDIAGLISPEVVPLIGDPQALWDLMEARDGRYLLAFADQIPNDDPSDPRLCPVYLSPGDAAIRAGGTKMVLYALAWDRRCPAQP